MDTSIFQDSQLLSSLQTALESSQRLALPKDQQPRQFQVALIHSHARRSYSLFPWTAQVSQNSVFVEDFLLVCSERISNTAEAGEKEEERYVPVYGLEGSLFTLSASNARLAYISKVDSTGLSPHAAGSPASVLTAAFLSWLLHACRHSHFRLHIFAKAASQYLFPSSAENPTKRQLTDKQLAKWWTRILTSLASPESVTLSGYALIPGLEWIEIRRLLSPLPDNWTVGLPTKPLVDVPESQQPTLGDIIPAFPDDPKSRYLTSLTSSPLGPAGEQGDYDEQYKALLHNNAGPAQMTEFEAQRSKEKRRLAETSIDAFLEGLAWRQECCAGSLVGFLVLASEPKEGRAKEDLECPKPAKAGLPHAAYIKLWNAFHNTSYRSKAVAATDGHEGASEQDQVQRIVDAYRAWKSKLKDALAEGGDALLIDATVTASTVDPTAKRKAEETANPAEATQQQQSQQPSVMTLKPRKKAKPAPAQT